MIKFLTLILILSMLGGCASAGYDKKRGRGWCHGSIEYSREYEGGKESVKCSWQPFKGIFTVAKVGI
mgnify:CR=1 FL=1